MRIVIRRAKLIDLPTGSQHPCQLIWLDIYVAKIWLAASKKYGATVVLHLLTMSQLVLVLLNTMRVF